LADTAALVVALSAQLTKFEKDMRAAGIMADKAVSDIEDKFSKINPQVSASFLGNLFSNLVTKGLDAAIKAVSDFTDGFIALKAAADLAEISLAKVYGISAALGKDASANAGAIEKLTVMLDQMRRGQETTFGDLKAANPAFFQNMGKDTFDVAENMARVAEMVKQAGSEVEKWEIARQAGFTRDMVKELEKGGEHFRQMTADNQAIGRTMAIAAAQAEVLKTALAEAAKNALGLNTAMSDFYKDSVMMLGGLLAGLQKFRELASNSWGAGGGRTGGLADPVIKDLDTLQTKLKSAGDEAATFKERFDAATGKGTKTADPNKPLAHPAVRDTGGDTQSAFERQNDQITKHIALMEADTAAVGKNVGEQERLKTIALLKTAAERDGVTVTAEMTRQMEAQADAAARARLALAQAQYQLAQINQASQVLGSALSSAFADAIIEGKKLNEVMSSLLKTLARAAINAGIMSIFTPGAGGGLSPFAGLFKAGGGPVAAGQSYIVGEQGPELFRPQSAGMVIPNSVLRQGGSQGGAIVYSPAIDARGASVEAVARLAQIMEADRATFASRTVATIQQARRARIAGV
jgi:hypothetical protein